MINNICTNQVGTLNASAMLKSLKQDNLLQEI